MQKVHVLRAAVHREVFRVALQGSGQLASVLSVPRNGSDIRCRRTWNERQLFVRRLQRTPNEVSTPRAVQTLHQATYLFHLY
jgi:hypothetical protein